MISRGQLWSLDVVLAAVIFTLAIGVVISQSELSIFYSQQERNQHEVLAMTLMASNNLVSQGDIMVELIPKKCANDPTACSSCGLPVCPIGGNTTNAKDYHLNVKCGPNFLWVKAGFGAGSPHTATARGWVADKELSGLENCIVSRDTPMRQEVLNLPLTYLLDVNALLVDGNGILFYTADTVGNAAYFSLTRKMVVFPDHPVARDLRECMDGNCFALLTDVNISVWRFT